MVHRNIASEVLKGLQEVREPLSRTAHTEVQAKRLPELTPDAIRKSRHGLGLSRAVFAHMPRVPVRTLEGSEQGSSRPPDSARALILMSQKYPDTLDRLVSYRPPTT